MIIYCLFLLKRLVSETEEKMRQLEMKHSSSRGGNDLGSLLAKAATSSTPSYAATAAKGMKKTASKPKESDKSLGQQDDGGKLMRLLSSGGTGEISGSPREGPPRPKSGGGNQQPNSPALNGSGSGADGGGGGGGGGEEDDKNDNQVAAFFAKINNRTEQESKPSAFTSPNTAAPLPPPEPVLPPPPILGGNLPAGLRAPIPGLFPGPPHPHPLAPGVMPGVVPVFPSVVSTCLVVSACC